MILSHAILLDQCQKVLSDSSSLFFRREKDSQSCVQKSCLSARSYLESRGAEVGPKTELVSMTHPFSSFSAPNKKEGEKQENGWVANTSEFCLRIHLRRSVNLIYFYLYNTGIKT